MNEGFREPEWTYLLCFMRFAVNSNLVFVHTTYESSCAKVKRLLTDRMKV